MFNEFKEKSQKNYSVQENQNYVKIALIIFFQELMVLG